MIEARRLLVAGDLTLRARTKGDCVFANAAAFGQAKPLPRWPGCAYVGHSGEADHFSEADINISVRSGGPGWTLDIPESPRLYRRPSV